MIFSLTDETFSLLCDLKVPEGMREERVSFYISLLDHCYWILGSCVGALAGSVLPIDTTGIDFSMTALFTVIVVNQWMDTKEHKPQSSEALSEFCVYWYWAQTPFYYLH